MDRVEGEVVVAGGDFGVGDGDVALVGVDAVGRGFEADEAEAGDGIGALEPDGLARFQVGCGEVCGGAEGGGIVFVNRYDGE